MPGAPTSTMIAINPHWTSFEPRSIGKILARQVLVSTWASRPCLLLYVFVESDGLGGLPVVVELALSQSARREEASLVHLVQHLRRRFQRFIEHRVEVADALRRMAVGPACAGLAKDLRHLEGEVVLTRRITAVEHRYPVDQLKDGQLGCLVGHK